MRCYGAGEHGCEYAWSRVVPLQRYVTGQSQKATGERRQLECSEQSLQRKVETEHVGSRVRPVTITHACG